MVSTKKKLEELLVDCCSDVKRIRAAAVIRRDGLVIASHIPDQDSDHAAACAASLAGSARTVLDVFEAGEFSSLTAQASKGYMILTETPTDHLLLINTTGGDAVPVDSPEISELKDRVTAVLSD